jgi:hypothetical protein
MEPRIVTGGDDNNKGCVVSRKSANTNFPLLTGSTARSALLAGASHVKQLFVYLSYPAGQLSSAISGTRLSSDSREVTVHMPCASTLAPAWAPR